MGKAVAQRLDKGFPCGVQQLKKTPRGLSCGLERKVRFVLAGGKKKKCRDVLGLRGSDERNSMSIPISRPGEKSVHGDIIGVAIR